MTQGLQLTSPMMGRPAGLDPDSRGLQFLKERKKLLTPHLVAQNRLLGRINPVQHKNTLGRVHSNADKLVHGRLPGMRSLQRSLILAHRCRRVPSTPTYALFSLYGTGGLEGG